MNTLDLTQPDSVDGGWDLFLDANKNLAINKGAAAVAQDVASACKLFAGDLYYDQTRGIPYFEQILGREFNAPLMASFLSAAALSVPTVLHAQVINLRISGRKLTGDVRVIDEQGAALLAHF